MRIEDIMWLEINMSILLKAVNIDCDGGITVG